MKIILLVLSLLIPITVNAEEDYLLQNVLMVRPLELDGFSLMLINSQMAHIKKTEQVFDVDLPLPTFLRATKAEMRDLYKRLNKIDADVEALYVHTDLDPLTGEEIPSRTIYLPMDWKPDNAEYRALLYHELVHYVQYMNELNRHVSCAKVLEYQAYMMTATYLVEKEGLSNKDLTVIGNKRDAVSQGPCPKKVKPSK